MQSSKRKTKIVKGKLFFHKPQNSLVRIVNINKKENRVVLYRFSDEETMYIEYDTAHLFLDAAFKIGEVANMLNRSVDTIRKYERENLVKKCRKEIVGQQEIRIYTEDDVLYLADFFATRNPVGRPTGRKNSKIDRTHLIKNLRKRIEEVT